MNIQEFNERFDRNEPIEFGAIFNQSLNLFQQTWVQGFLFCILSFAVVLCLYLMVFIPLYLLGGLGMMTFSPLENINSSTLNPLVIFAIVGIELFFFMVVLTIINGMTGGLFLILKKRDDEEEYRVNDFFVLLKGENIKKTFVLSLIQIAIILASFLLCGLPLLYLAIPLRFMPVVYAFNPELTPSEITSLSFKLGNRTWAVAFFLSLILGFLAELGVLLCGVGLLFTAILPLIPFYIMYKDSIGFEDEGNNFQTEIDQIGNTEI